VRLHGSTGSATSLPGTAARCPSARAEHHAPGDYLAKISSEPRPKVTFDLEDQSAVVRLTVAHDGFDSGSAAPPGISEGWPRSMADLKTLLETGDLQPAG
jgi:activator of Hsp90 ATPase-like protein